MQHHCDNCAGDLPAAYIEAHIMQEHVFCCSGRCVAQLLTVWAPARRLWPWREGVALVSMALMMLLW